MTSVVKITCLFAEARDNRTKVSVTPNDDHAVEFKEDLLNVCLQIDFEGTNAGNPSGTIHEGACYRVTVATNTSYNRQVAARANYNLYLQEDDPARRSKE